MHKAANAPFMHIKIMGFLGIGNNPMVGCTVAAWHRPLNTRKASMSYTEISLLIKRIKSVKF